MEIQSGNRWITIQRRRWACTTCTCLYIYTYYVYCMYTLSVQCVIVSFSNLRYDGEFWMEFFKDFCREFEVQTLVLSSFLEVIKGDS